MNRFTSTSTLSLALVTLLVCTGCSDDEEAVEYSGTFLSNCVQGQNSFEQTEAFIDFEASVSSLTIRGYPDDQCVEGMELFVIETDAIDEYPEGESPHRGGPIDVIVGDTFMTPIAPPILDAFKAQCSDDDWELGARKQQNTCIFPEGATLYSQYLFEDENTLYFANSFELGMTPEERPATVDKTIIFKRIAE